MIAQIKNFIDENAALAAQYPILTDIYSWMRDLWEHNISHYWYAFGAVGMACVWAWAYRDVYLPSGLTTRTDRALWLLAALLYGVTIGLVAVQFPAGSLVALVFLGGYGFGVVGSALYRRGEVSKPHDSDKTPNRCFSSPEPCSSSPLSCMSRVCRCSPGALDLCCSTFSSPT
jgi:hypothetical protein